MTTTLVAQYLFNGLMLGVIYAMVAVGFSLFFGVLDVINLSHGDVLAAGAFASVGGAAAVSWLGLPGPVGLVVGFLAGTAVGALLGAGIAKALVMPLRRAPPVNVILATLMAGTVLRELIRLFVPGGSNPTPFPQLLPSGQLRIGSFSTGYDNLIVLAAGVGVMIALQLVITRTRLGLAIRAVAQDEESARLAGVNFDRVILGTFAIASATGSFAGCLIGIYYREVTFDMGLLLGVIGFTAATVGGLGSVLGAILGGFLFAAVQTFASVAMPFSGAYKDVVAFAAMIVLIAIFPTGLIPEKTSERA
jgi:branched-chain amino acid transport system permease protein